MLDSNKFISDIIKILNSDVSRSKPTQETLVSEIREDNEEISIILEVPGIQNREDINFSILTTSATIKGIRQKIGSTSTSDKTTQGIFEKKFNLPVPVRPETASAIYSKGVLTLKLKKLKEKPWSNVFVQFL